MLLELQLQLYYLCFVTSNALSKPASKQPTLYDGTASTEAALLLLLLRMQAEVDRWLDVAAALESSAASWVQPTCQQASDEVCSRLPLGQDTAVPAAGHSLTTPTQLVAQQLDIKVLCFGCRS